MLTLPSKHFCLCSLATSITSCTTEEVLLTANARRSGRILAANPEHTWIGDASSGDRPSLTATAALLVCRICSLRRTTEAVSPRLCASSRAFSCTSQVSDNNCNTSSVGECSLDELDMLSECPVGLKLMLRFFHFTNGLEELSTVFYREACTKRVEQGVCCVNSVRSFDKLGQLLVSSCLENDVVDEFAQCLVRCAESTFGHALVVRGKET